MPKDQNKNQEKATPRAIAPGYSSKDGANVPGLSAKDGAGPSISSKTGNVGLSAKDPNVGYSSKDQ